MSRSLPLPRHLPAALRRLRQSDRGASLVEFALLLPFLVLLFAVIIEGGRMMWSYQTAAAGVRDAARYLGRTVPSNICDLMAVGGSLSSYSPDIETQLRTRIETSVGGIDSVMPSLVTVDEVTATLEDCNAGGFRVPEVGVISVSAVVNIEFPFEALLGIMGGGIPTSITTTITDRTRVFGA